MGLKEQITNDMKEAMRAKDAKTLGTIRLLTAAMKQKEVDERVELTDTDILAIIEKMIKQRRDSIAQFEKGDRKDLVEQEQGEIDVLQKYMPAALSQEEIEKAVLEAAKGASGIKDMGKVMATLKTQLAGRADMSAVSALVKKALSA